MIRCLVLYLCLASSAFCAEDSAPEAIPAIPPRIVFPVLPTPDKQPVAPAPPADPDAVPTLAYGQIYVVQSETAFILLASPRELVTITPTPGPIAVRGVFVDGTGKVETRTFQSKYVAFVDAGETASGRLELMAVPAGVTDEWAISRQLLEVNHGPQPPPKPVDPVNPVDPPAPAPTGFRVVFAYESSAALTREQLNILNSTQITAFLNTNCAKGADGRADWRKWDRDISISPKESAMIVELWNAAKPKLGTLPQMIVAVDGKATVMDLPATEAETLEKLKTIAGVK